MSKTEEMILLPRRVVAALVDPKKHGFAGIRIGNWQDYECNFCKLLLKTKQPHAVNCPVFIVQEALAAAAVTHKT